MEGHPEELSLGWILSKSYFISESQCTRTATDPRRCLQRTFEPPVLVRNHGWSAHRLYDQTTARRTATPTNRATSISTTCRRPSSPSPSLIDVSGTDGPNGQVEQVTNLSEDGNTSRFVAKGVSPRTTMLSTNRPKIGDTNLYVWHRDASHPEVKRNSSEDRPCPVSVLRSPRGEGRYLAFETSSQWSRPPTMRRYLSL